MATDTILQEILSRVDTDPAFFLWDEVALWPDGLIENLVNQGLLATAPRAQQVVCKGCERACIMSVQITPGKGKRPARALIACDKEENFGLVSVELTRLQRWKITPSQVATVIGKLLGIESTPTTPTKSGSRSIGKVAGSKRNGLLTLETTSPISLGIAGNTLPLTEAMRFEGNRIGIDRDAITDLADQPPSDDQGRYQPSTARREARKLGTQARHESWQKAYRTLKKANPGKSDKWCSIQISQMAIAENAASETIRKQMKK